MTWAFIVICLGTFLTGLYASCVEFYRFADDHAAWDIQWRVLAMFTPSLAVGKRIARFSNGKVTADGLFYKSHNYGPC
ncbi:Riboflavin transporter RfnT [Sulfitobacter sp. DSM 110093]|nr:Riboflavin transporter RfnT [Sulfitobacter sp. DSM 110093]